MGLFSLAFRATKEYFMGWTATSANGRGRTLLDIILGRNKKKMGPIEFQYHNPFEMRVGNSVTIEHDMRYQGINFFVDAIMVYETKEGRQKFYDTEYSLRGQALGMTKPLYLRLRVTPDDQAVDQSFPYKLQVLEKYDEMAWDKGFWDYLHNTDLTFQVNKDDAGADLPDGQERMYWRVDDAPDPYTCNLTILKDVNRDGRVEEEELEHRTVTFWDYSRTTTDDGTGKEYTEFLNIEMDNDKRLFRLFRGRDVMPFQVKVI